MQIAVLGAGMVGHAIALDLAATHAVTAFDASADNLAALQQKNPAIRTVQADLRQTDQYKEWLAPFGLVVTAVPGFMGYATLQATIAAGKHVADISFFPENALTLDALARQHGVTVITDCGVAPGMSNLVLGRYNALMKIDSFACYVGGLPRYPQPPFYYKAPFSPIDVIEEYTRPARLVQNGQIVTLPALTDRELMEAEGAGTLEAFNTDGLRSLLYTMSHIPDMKEKTWRYPGHLDLIIALQQAGLFSTTPVMVNGQSIRPLDMAVSLLLPQWKLQPGEEELTVMQIIIKGEGKTIRYDLLDYYNTTTGISSMARTTGYTCTAAAELILQGLFTEKGVYPPELVGNREECFDFVLSYLKKRGVRWRRSGE